VRTASRARVATAACLMASGLLVAGTGASLALAEPETGQGGTGSPQVGGSTSSPHEGGSTGTKEPTTAAPGTEAVAPGGTATGSSGKADAESKPTSQVGDGRNGLQAGHPTGTPVLGAATDPASKQTQHASGAPSQSGAAAASEQAPGGTSAVVGEPGGTAVVDVPPVVEPPVEGQEPGTEPPTEGESAGTPDDPKTPKDPNHPRGWHHPHDPNDPNHPYDPKDPKNPHDSHNPHDPNDPDDPNPWEGHHPGLPWSWWKGCSPPGLPPGSGGGGGHGGANPEPPIWHPPKPPEMQLPIPREAVPDLEDIAVPFFDAVAGLATAASDLPFEPLTLPVIVVPGGGAAGGGGGGVGGPGAAPRPGMPSGSNPPASRGGSTEPPQSGRQQSPPAFSAGNRAMPPPSYRMGYGEYLRAAGLGEVAAVAIPGFTGILMLTGAGGLIGYRQARAGRSVRSSGTARFVS
jgi:hypothetical protein